MAANAYQIGQLIAQLGLNNAQFTAGMQASIVQMGAADAAMKKASMSIQAQMTAIGTKAIATGKMMTRALTLPIVAIGVGATKTFADFEASMAKIVGLVGVAEGQVNQWKGAIKDLGVEMGRSPTELADAMFFITSAGLRGAAAMDVLRISAKASVAGLGEVKTVADLLTSAINAYGAATLNATDASDILTAAVRAGKAEADSIAGAMGNVIPIASAMGMTFADLNASIAGMTRTGTPALKAATQLKAILSAMAAPSIKAEKAMNDMGYSSEQFRKTLKEKGFIEALLELKNTTDQFGGETALAKVFPNIRALVGVFDLLGSNLEENRKVYDQVRNSAGLLDEAHGAVTDTLKHQFNIAIATVKRTLTDLGEAMKGPIVEALNNIGEKIRKLTFWWNGLSDAQKQAKLRIAGLIAAAGPLLIIAGKLTKLMAGPMLNAMRALTKAALANPWVALAVAIALVVGGVMKLIRARKEAAETSTAVDRAMQKTSDRFHEQSMKVQFLSAKIRDNTRSNDDRKRAIVQLKAIIPEYNGMISEEGRLINDNREAIENYLVTLKEKIRVQAFEEEYTELIRRQIQARKDLDKAEEEAFKKKQALEAGGGPKEDIAIPTSFGGVGVSTGTVTPDKLLGDYNKAQKEAAALQEELNGLIADQVDLEKQALDFKIDLNTAIPETPEEVVPDPGDAGGDGADPIVDLKAQEDAKTQLIQAAENERAGIIQNSFARQRQLEILAFERQKAVYEQMATEFPELRAQADAAIEALATGHQARLASIAQKGWQNVIKESLKGTEEGMTEFQKHMEKMTEIADAWTTAGGQLQQVFNGIGSAIGLANNQAAQWISYVGRILGAVAGLIGTIKKLVLAKQAEATADAISSAAKLPFPANLIAIAASVASVLASFASIPKLAEGGLAYGKTVAEIGEYPGASSNPEVIAPLNSLKKLIQPANTFGLPKTLELVLSGRNAKAMIDFEEMMLNTY